MQKIFILLCCLIAGFCHGQNASSLSAEIEKMKSDKDLSGASLGIFVLNLKTDSVIAASSENTGLIPASILKIITTASALSILGASFRYATFLEYDGTLDTAAGILKGNLYIRGSGDPSLDSETFRRKGDTSSITAEWAKILLSKGIKKIDGAVVADGTVFEEETIPYSWAWGDMGNYYGAGASGLNFRDNKFTLLFKSGNSAGESTIITEVSPEIPGMKIFNNVITKGYSDNAYIYGAPYSLVRYVKGTIPANKTDYAVHGSMPDPPLLCAQMLDSAMHKVGITIAKRAFSLRNFLPANMSIETTLFDSVPEEKEISIALRNDSSGLNNTENKPKAPVRKILHTHFSPSLEKIVYYTNIQSNNLYAEALLKTIAWKKTRYGDDVTGTSVVYNLWKQKGVDLNGFYMADGSGLSRWNLISAKQMTGILSAIARDSVLFHTFYGCLPIAGKSGSLGKLCKGTLAENNLRAKSGYMTRVRSYAGYVTSKKGNLLAFAIIVNNYACTPKQMKEKLEKLLVKMAETE